jgi:F-type H+-transporting ATPase subunit a
MFPLDFSNNSLLLSGVEIGTHFYWDIGNIALHGQVFIVSWFVIAILIVFSFLGTQNPERIPQTWQNFMESVIEFTQDIAKKSIRRKFLPTMGTIYQYTFPIYFWM